MRDDPDWKLVVPFLTDSKDFAFGVQFGMDYQRMVSERPAATTLMVSRELQDQYLLMLGRIDYVVREQRMIDEHWMQIDIHDKLDEETCEYYSQTR